MGISEQCDGGDFYTFLMAAIVLFSGDSNVDNYCTDGFSTIRIMCSIDFTTQERVSYNSKGSDKETTFIVSGKFLLF